MQKLNLSLKPISIVLLILGACLLTGAAIVSQIRPFIFANNDKVPTLVLTERNTLSFNQEVNDESVGQLQSRLMAMSQNLAVNDPIILVLYTPGGSVTAGLDLINTIHAIPQKVTTLTLFSASMGFHIVQNSGLRLITANGVMMSHRASGGHDGQLNGSFESRYKNIMRVLMGLDQVAANRMKIKLEAYEILIKDEYWATGADAVYDKAADQVVNVYCDETLKGTYEEDIHTSFGPATVTFSKCPIIVAPLGYENKTNYTKEYL